MNHKNIISPVTEAGTPRPYNHLDLHLIKASPTKPPFGSQHLTCFLCSSFQFFPVHTAHPSVGHAYQSPSPHMVPPPSAWLSLWCCSYPTKSYNSLGQSLTDHPYSTSSQTIPVSFSTVPTIVLQVPLPPSVPLGSLWRQHK